jgi:hypothetical protein
MNDKYPRFKHDDNYPDYARKRDEHLYQLWKQGKTKAWMADYIDRSKERVRQLVRKFESRARNEETHQ